MQVTSLLSVPKSIAGTTTAVVKNHWKDIAATMVLRIAKCFDVTYPAHIFIAVIAFVVALMTSVMTFHSTPTWTGAIVGTMWKGGCLTLLAWAVMYAIYELHQGFKWLTKWSERVKYEKEQKARKF